MKVLLKVDVKDLGRKGEVHEVSKGFARNLLLKKGLASVASEADYAQYQERLKKAETDKAESAEENKKLASRLQNQIVRITPSKTSSAGKLFGSISEEEVASEIKKQLGIAVPASGLSFSEPLKTVGTHSATVRLGVESATLSIEILSNNS